MPNSGSCGSYSWQHQPLQPRNLITSTTMLWRWQDTRSTRTVIQFLTIWSPWQSTRSTPTAIRHHTWWKWQDPRCIHIAILPLRMTWWGWQGTRSTPMGIHIRPMGSGCRTWSIRIVMQSRLESAQSFRVSTVSWLFGSGTWFFGV